MGQLALGFRSLIVKATIFVIMAALLAWALGGTLFPRPEVITFDGVKFAGENWFWRMSVSEVEPIPVRWEFMREAQGSRAEPVDQRSWVDAVQPMVNGESLYYAGLALVGDPSSWLIIEIRKDGEQTVFPMPDRLAIEQQLGRVRKQLQIQTVDEITRQRSAVLDPHLH